MLENKFDVAKEIIFPDHYQYSLKDIKKIQEICERKT